MIANTYFSDDTKKPFIPANRIAVKRDIPPRTLHKTKPPNRYGLVKIIDRLANIWWSFLCWCSNWILWYL